MLRIFFVASCTIGTYSYGHIINNYLGFDFKNFKPRYFMLNSILTQ